jgi:histidinol-phosphate aminotransferase
MTSPQPLPGILDIQPYAGGESEIVGMKTVIKLASNEGALGPSRLAVEAARAAAEGMHRYPDGDYGELRDALSEFHGLEKTCIVVGAGSDEIIYHLCRAYSGPGAEVLHSAHGFAMYPIYAKAAGAVTVAAPEREITADVDALLERVSERTKLVFIANPNNPTGTCLTASEVARLRAGLAPHILLVIDSAYAEYVAQDDYSTGEELVAAAENVVMLRTFSKMYAMGGMRLGWAYCPEAVADVIHRVRSPFNVSIVAQAAGIAALGDTDFVARSFAHNETWRAWLTDELRGLGLTVPDSVCNFVLARFPDDDAGNAEKADAFLKNRGIITRRMAGYGLADALRITIGLETEMRAVAGALAEFMG